MKRPLCFALIILLLLSLTACSFPGQSEVTQTQFYYRQREYLFDSSPGSVISPEIRDISGHGDDLSYLLSLYLMGPLDESLASPFPTYTKLLSLDFKDDGLYIELSDTSSSMNASAFSLACGCITLTCLELVDVPAVTITCGKRILTMDSESILLPDMEPVETTNGGN